MELITATHNYLPDLIKATKAGLFTREGRNPAKRDLYAAIEEHNLEVLKACNSDDSIEVAPVVEVAPMVAELIEVAPVVEVTPMVAELIEVAPVVEVTPMVAESTEAYDILRSQSKTAKVAKQAKEPKKVKTAQAAKQPDDCIYAAKDNKSSPGKKIVDLIGLLQVGATKEEICKTFQWKDWNPKTTVVLNYGYTIKAEKNVFSIAK